MTFQIMDAAPAPTAPADPSAARPSTPDEALVAESTRREREARLAARDERLRDRDARLAARAERLRAREERLDAQERLDWANLVTAMAESQAEEQAALVREWARLTGEDEGDPRAAAAKGKAATRAAIPEVEALPAAARERLAAFPPSRVAEIAGVAGASAAPADTSWWPDLLGCLVILFTARSGSTFLSREVEARYDLGRVGESLNPAQLRARPIGPLLAPRADRWFGCKAGVQGIVAGEMAGFFEIYLKRCVFLQLVRRDIVAQAVSLDRAERTGGWHEKAEAGEELPYDGARITRAINIIAGRVESLRAWAERAGRPRRTVIYEEIAEGDFSAALAACDALGAPARPPGEAAELRAVERMGDDLNARWKARYEAEMNTEMADKISDYHATL